MMGDDLRRLIAEEGEYSEVHRDDPMPETVRATRPNRGRSVMFSLRLNPEELAAVQDLAQAGQVPVSALVRGWIVQRLEAERHLPTDTAAVVGRLEEDLRMLRKLVTS